MPEGYQLCQVPLVEQYGRKFDYNKLMQQLYGFIESDLVAQSHTDFIITYPGWDKLFMKLLKTKKIIGFDCDLEKVPHTPMIMIFAETNDFIARQIDFTADHVFDTTGKRHVVQKKVANAEEAKLFRMPIGSVMKCDGAWRLPFSYQPLEMLTIDASPIGTLLQLESHRNYRCACKEIHRCRKHNIPILKRTHKYHRRYKKVYKRIREYPFRGKLLATHLGSSHKITFDDDTVQSWVRAIRMYLDHNP